MFGNLGPFELVLLFLVILLIFGAKRIPEIARGLGKGIREFKDATREITSSMEMDEPSQQQRQIRRPEPPHGQTAPRNQNATRSEGMPRSEGQEPPAQPSRAEDPSE